MQVLQKQKDGIYKAINDITLVILNLKKSVLDTNDVGLVSKYRSKIEEFRQLPPELKISLPNFFASEDQQIGDSETIWILNPIYL